MDSLAVSQILFFDFDFDFVFSHSDYYITKFWSPVSLWNETEGDKTNKKKETRQREF